MLVASGNPKIRFKTHVRTLSPPSNGSSGMKRLIIYDIIIILPVSLRSFIE